MALNTPSSFTSFGELLKHLRLRAQITQRDLAARVGYNHAHLSRLENNQRVPDAATIRALFIPALDLENEPEWAARLLELAAPSPSVAGQRLQATDAPPRNPASSSISRLPLPFTSLLGRDDVLYRTRAMLSQPEVRLLTLVGPPGIGKTRLALEIASGVADQFPDGVVFIDLSSVRDPELVLSEAARALDVNENAEDLSASVVAALRSQSLLLVMDNFEQVVDAAPQVTTWLQGSPGLRVLVTSREALHVSGEYEFPVPPLPPEAQLELFVQRACAVQPGFELTSENQPVISEICQRLDGLPLAIELAAARVKQFSAPAMAARLGQRLQWLTGGKRDGPAWRQTLRGAIDWSYNLLAPQESERWLRMSAFEGGCTPEAALAVIGASLEDLLSLSDKSLVSVVASGENDALRFTLLETLHEYARDRLSEDHAAHEDASRAHAAYYTELVEASSLDAAGEKLSAALNQLEIEYENLRAAMTWALDHMPGLALRLILRLGQFWYLRSHFREARRWQSAVLVHAEGVQRLTLTRQLGETCWNLGEHKMSRDYLEESVALARSMQVPAELANSLNLLGRAVKDMGAFEEASAHFAEGLDLARQHGDLNAQVALLRNLGNISLDHGDMQRALEYFEDSLAVARHADTPLGVAGALNNAGIAHLGMKDYGRAKACFLDALLVFQQYGNQFGTTLAIVNIGRVEHARGALAEARKNFETSLRLARETGRKWSMAYALSNLGLVAREEGQFAEAEKFFRESAEIALNASAPPRALDALSGWALLLARMGRPQPAAELMGLIQTHRAAEHESRERLQNMEAELRTLLTIDVLDAARTRGAGLKWDEAVRMCLAGFPPPEIQL